MGALAQQLRSDADYLDKATRDDIKKASGKQRRMEILLSSELRSLKALETISENIKKQSAKPELKEALLSVVEELIVVRKKQTDSLKKAINDKSFVIADDPSLDADYVVIDNASRDFDRKFQAACSKD